MLTALGWLAVAVLIAANALFVAAEFGLTSVDRAKLARLAGGGDRRAKTVQRAIRELSFQLSGAQLGITVCSLLLGFAAEPMSAAPAWRPAFRVMGLPDGAVDPVALVLALALATVAQSWCRRTSPWPGRCPRRGRSCHASSGSRGGVAVFG